MVPTGVRKRLYAWHPRRADRWRRFPGIERVPEGNVVLTFDDGPGQDMTPLVLEELSRANVRATFFMLGSQVAREAGLAREVCAAGHELALHGYDHLRYDKIGPDTARRDLEQGLRVIERVTGAQPRWFRPPFGRLSAASFEATRQLKLEIAYWSSWGLDWEEASPEDIEWEVQSTLSGGAIVLLHDTALYGRRASAVATAQAITSIVEHGRERGWSWRTLSEAVDLT